MLVCHLCVRAINTLIKMVGHVASMQRLTPNEDAATFVGKTAKEANRSCTGVTAERFPPGRGFYVISEAAHPIITAD